MKVSFPVFYHIWAELQGWTVPDFHYAVCDWLEKRGPLALLMMPRGHAKSSILDVYNAWKFYVNPDEQILHQGSTDPDAYKVSRGTERVLEAHPLTDLRETLGAVVLGPVELDAPRNPRPGQPHQGGERDAIRDGHRDEEGDERVAAASPAHRGTGPAHHVL